MLVQLGAKRTAADVGELLAECHTRIRSFLAMARRLATSPDATAEERRFVALQILRYFTEAFPLHIADEEELLAPHLSGQGSATTAIARMRADHIDHAPAIGALVDACSSIADEPEPSDAADAWLLVAADSVSELLEPHLVLEEREIFTALATLPPAARAEILAGMRARREAHASLASRRAK